MGRLPTWLTHWYTDRGAVGIVSGFVLALLMFGLYTIDFPGVHPEDRLFAEDASPAPDVVIVGIDDASIAALGHFPFTRDAYANALDNLTRAGAAAVVFDVGFSEPYTTAGDQRFHSSLITASKAKVPVVLAYGSADLVYGDHKVTQATVDASGNLESTQDELPIRPACTTRSSCPRTTATCSCRASRSTPTS